MAYAFADCELDTRQRELRRGGAAVPLEPQVFDVLAYLVEHRDRVVPKDELYDRIWGHRFVTDATLSSRISTARRAVGDDGQSQRLIRTLVGRGFRFVGQVAVREGAAGGGDDRAPAGAAGPPLPVAPGTGPAARGTAPAQRPEGAGAPEGAPPLPPTGLVTFLLARPVGGTLLLGGGPGAYRESVARARALLGEAAAAHGGVVFPGVGDAIAAAFGSPAAAVAAALAGQLALEEGAWEGAPPVRARIGLHTGAAAQRDADYSGEALLRCARLAAYAQSGQVLLSEATATLAREALPEGAALYDLGVHRLADVPRPGRRWRPRPPGGRAPRPRGAPGRRTRRRPARPGSRRLRAARPGRRPPPAGPDASCRRRRARRG